MNFTEFILFSDRFTTLQRLVHNTYYIYHSSDDGGFGVSLLLSSALTPRLQLDRADKFPNIAEVPNMQLPRG